MYCICYLGDLTAETSSPISKVFSAGFQQRQNSSFDTCVKFSSQVESKHEFRLWELNFFLKKGKRKTTKLHWCQLIWGFQLHVQFLMWGCPHARSHSCRAGLMLLKRWNAADKSRQDSDFSSRMMQDKGRLTFTHLKYLSGISMISFLWRFKEKNFPARVIEY